MIKVNPTTNLIGISIRGDYADFNDLIDSIYRLTSFDDDLHDFHYGVKNRLLGLCYDVRHAYMGDRDVVLEDNVKIGNFVEVKKTVIKSNTNACHLSYLGDSEIGSNVNIGAGTITANYNPLSKLKSKTIIADNVKIGSNSVLVAPVEIKKGANVAALSVITKEIPEWALAITRAPLKILENWVKNR